MLMMGSSEEDSISSRGVCPSSSSSGVVIVGVMTEFGWMGSKVVWGKGKRDGVGGSSDRLRARWNRPSPPAHEDPRGRSSQTPTFTLPTFVHSIFYLISCLSYMSKPLPSSCLASSSH
jgi:hypothetical protein